MYEEIINNVLLFDITIYEQIVLYSYPFFLLSSCIVIINLTQDSQGLPLPRKGLEGLAALRD